MDVNETAKAVVDQMLAKDRFTRWLGAKVIELGPGKCVGVHIDYGMRSYLNVSINDSAKAPELVVSLLSVQSVEVAAWASRRVFHLKHTGNTGRFAQHRIPFVGEGCPMLRMCD